MVDAHRSDRDRMPPPASRKRARDAELDEIGASIRATRARGGREFEEDQEFDGLPPSFSLPLFPSLRPLPIVLHASCGRRSHSFVPIALFGLFLPGRSCVPAAGPITGSRSAEWSKFHQALADADCGFRRPAPC